MDSRRVYLLLTVAFFLFLTPNPQPPSALVEKEHERAIAEETRELRLLNGSQYGDFNSTAGRWLPIAGLREEDGYAWDLLPFAQNRAKAQLGSTLVSAGVSVHDLQSPDLNITELPLPVYRNVTGKVFGDWARVEPPTEIAKPHLNITAIVAENDYISRDFSLNATADTGTLFINMHEELGEELHAGDGAVREIKAEMIIRNDVALNDRWGLSLFGVHFPKSGGIILSTTSEKFSGLASLPHFALSRDTFELSRRILGKSLSDALSEKQKHGPTFYPWSSLPHGSQPMGFPTPKCEYIVFLQHTPISINRQMADDSLLGLIEDELRFPVGAPIPRPPPMVMSAVVVSPDCGFVLESRSPPHYPRPERLEDIYLVGPKQEDYSRSAGRLVVTIAGVLAAQLGLLKRQVREASTPSTRSRISFYTMAMMSMGEGLLMSFLLLHLYSDTSFLALTATSFLSLFSVSFLGMKFQIEIWVVQAPERREQERAAATPTQPQPPQPAEQFLPLPVTARRPVDTGATPIIIAPDQDEPLEEEMTPTGGTTGGANESGNDAGSMYTRFYFTYFCLFVFSSWALIWPTKLGYIYANLLALIYLSFWTPQIYRNVMRNCPKALRWEFVIGESILRLFPFIYFYTVRGNVLFIRPNHTMALIFVGWVWLQVWILLSQDFLGPRFFVPNGWAPPAYDYHPILRDTSEQGSEADLESGGTMPIGYLRCEERDATDQHPREAGKDRRKKIFDCAICMQDIEVPVMSDRGVADGATTLLARRSYMVTPCRHIFHSACLESWMRLRLQCPICRESIPPT